MDEELRNLLTQLLEGQQRLGKSIYGLDIKINGLKTDIAELKNNIKNQSAMLSIEKKLDRITDMQTIHNMQDKQNFHKLKNIIESASEDIS